MSSFRADTPFRTTRRRHFWVAGERVEIDGKRFQRGPMWVRWEAPERVTQQYPVVLSTAGRSRASKWLDTPDGRPGWAQRLVEAGCAVLVVDRPEHGRSPYHPDLLGPMGPPFAYEESRHVFVLQTQWPFELDDVDAFGDFIAGFGPMPADLAASQTMDATGSRGCWTGSAQRSS